MDLIVTVINLILLGIAGTAVLNLLAAVVRYFRQEDDEPEEIKEVTIRIDVVEHNGKDLFLIYEAVRNQFLFQTNTIDEMRDHILTKFKNKTVTIGTNVDQPISLLTLRM